MILDEYYTEQEIAALLGKKVSTLRSDHCLRNHKGCVPPKTKIGRRIFYKKESFSNWLKSREIPQRKYK